VNEKIVNLVAEMRVLSGNFSYEKIILLSLMTDYADDETREKRRKKRRVRIIADSCENSGANVKAIICSIYAIK
jgi:hypothetical protein